MKFRNLYKAEATGKFPVSSITGILTVIITVVLGFGLINQIQADGLQANLSIIVQAATEVAGAVAAIIQLFKLKE